MTPSHLAVNLFCEWLIIGSEGRTLILKESSYSSIVTLCFIKRCWFKSRQGHIVFYPSSKFSVITKTSDGLKVSCHNAKPLSIQCINKPVGKLKIPLTKQSRKVNIFWIYVLWKWTFIHAISFFPKNLNDDDIYINIFIINLKLDKLKLKIK